MGMLCAWGCMVVLLMGIVSGDALFESMVAERMASGGKFSENIAVSMVCRPRVPGTFDP